MTAGSSAENLDKGCLRGAVPLCHFLLRQRVQPGDRVVDATCGNGQDTQLLAELVGSGGRVWAFDIQGEALTRTSARLKAAGCGAQVELLQAGHERLADLVSGPLQAVIFNLGYLPAGDREIRTVAATTGKALAQAAALLAPGGIILLAVYTGHAGGLEEWATVREWGAALDPREFNVWQARQMNRSEAAPFVVLVEKVCP